MLFKIQKVLKKPNQRKILGRKRLEIHIIIHPYDFEKEKNIQNSVMPVTF